MSDNGIDWKIIERAINEQRWLRQQVDQNANTLADLLMDSLESVSHYKLRKIKKKLERFNMTTGAWKP